MTDHEPMITLGSGERVYVASVGLLESLRRHGCDVHVDGQGDLVVVPPALEPLHPDVLAMIESLEYQLVAILHDYRFAKVH